MPFLKLVGFLPIDLFSVANSSAHTELSEPYTLHVSASGEEFQYLETTSMEAKLMIDVGSVLLKPIGREHVFAGAIISAGGSIIHDSAMNQVLNGDLSGFERDIAALNTEGTLRVGSPIVLGGYRNTYTVAADGSLLFGGEGGLSKTVSVKNDFSIVTSCAGFDNVTLQYHEAAIGTNKTISSSGGLAVRSGDLTAKTDFGRSIINQTTQGLKVNETGSFRKTGFGDFELRTALSTQHDSSETSAIYIEAGTLRLAAQAIEGPSGVVQGVSDIDISGAGVLEIALDTNRTFERIVSGDGAINLKSERLAESQLRLTIAASCVLCNKGNVSISEGVHLVFGHNLSVWRPGTASEINIQASGGLTLRGHIIPQGNIFNPYFTQGQGMIFADGRTDITIAPERNSLVIGNKSDTLKILSEAALFLSPDSHKVMELQYPLQSDDSTALLATAGNGRLLLQGSVLENYAGVIKNDSTEGVFHLKNTTIHPEMGFDFGASSLAKTIFDIDQGAVTVGPYNTIQEASGSVSKTGAGRLVLDSTVGLNNWSGRLDIMEGAIELHNTTRLPSAKTYVQKNAQLIAWSHSNIDINLGKVSLASGSNLLITERDFIYRDHAVQHGEKRTVIISEINANAGSEIIFAVNPSGGLAASNASFNTALLKIEAANISAPIYVRMVPINNQPYELGAIHTLIEFDNPELAAEIAPKIKIRPTLRALSKIPYEGGFSVTNDTPLFASLALGQDSSGNFKYLVAQVNDLGFAPGLSALKKTNFTEIAYAPGTYLTQYLLGQNIAPYSALDSLLTGIVLNPHRTQDYMRVISPQAYNNSGTLHFEIRQFLQSGMAQEFKAYCQAFDQKLAGRLQHWDKKMQFITNTAQKMTADISGFGFQLNQLQVYGYQNIKSQSSYESKEQTAKGEISSSYHQAFARFKGTTLTLESLSSLASHQHSEQRDIIIEVEPSLIDKWVACSSYSSAEIQQDLAGWYKIQQSLGFETDIGIKTQANYIYIPPHTESGADNLSFFFDSQHYGYFLFNPSIAVRYHSHNMSMHLTASYQSQMTLQNKFSYGFVGAEQRYVAHANLSEAVAGMHFNVETTFMPLKGFVLQHHFSCLPRAQYQLSLTGTYTF